MWGAGTNEHNPCIRCQSLGLEKADLDYSTSDKRLHCNTPVIHAELAVEALGILTPSLSVFAARVQPGLKQRGLPGRIESLAFCGNAESVKQRSLTVKY